MNHSVLVFCPYYMAGGTESIQPLTSKYLNRLERLGYSVLRQLDTQPFSTSENIGRYMNHHRQFYRGFKRFLAGSWSHILIIEHDMLPPPYVVEKLLSCKADCAYSPYVFRHGNRQSTNILKVTNNRSDRNIGEPYSINELASMRTRRVIPCSGSAFGCTMFSQKAIANADLSFDETRPTYFDTTITKRLWKNRDLVFRANLNAKSKHYDPENQKWLSICPDTKR